MITNCLSIKCVCFKVWLEFLDMMVDQVCEQLVFHSFRFCFKLCISNFWPVESYFFGQSSELARHDINNFCWMLWVLKIFFHHFHVFYCRMLRCARRKRCAWRARRKRRTGNCRSAWSRRTSWSEGMFFRCFILLQ